MTKDLLFRVFKKMLEHNGKVLHEEVFVFVLYKNAASFFNTYPVKCFMQPWVQGVSEACLGYATSDNDLKEHTWLLI